MQSYRQGKEEILSSIAKEYKINPHILTIDDPSAALEQLLMSPTEEQMLKDLKDQLASYHPDPHKEIQQHQAMIFLYRLIQNRSAYDVFKFVSNPSFRRLNKPWFVERQLNRFIQQYNYFLEQSSPQILYEILLDNTIQRTITASEVKALLKRFDPWLIGKIFLTFPPNANVLRNDEGHILFNDISLLLAGNDDHIESLNTDRIRLKAQPFLPKESISITSLDKQMSKEHGFYHEKNMFLMAENDLRQLGRYRMINSSEDIRNSKLEPYYFSLISFNLNEGREHLLIDPEDKTHKDYRQFENLCADFRKCMADSSYKNTPVIFSGIVNVDHCIYVPYFFYRTLDQQVHVYTVNPLAKSHELASLRDILQYTIEKAFRHIFSDECQINYSNLKLNQVLRTEDTSVQSIETIKAALSGELFCLTKEGMLILNELEMKELIHHEPIAINPYTSEWIYSNKIEKVAEQTRLDWMKKISKQGLNDHDQEEVFTEFYKPSMIVSAQIALLESSEVGRKIIKQISDEYERKLVVPKADDVLIFINKNTKPEKLACFTHDKALFELAQEVVIEILVAKLQENWQIELAQKYEKSPTLLNDEKKLATEFINRHKKMFYGYFSDDRQKEMQKKCEEIVKRCAPKQLASTIKKHIIENTSLAKFILAFDEQMRFDPLTQETLKQLYPNSLPDGVDKTIVLQELNAILKASTSELLDTLTRKSKEIADAAIKKMKNVVDFNQCSLEKFIQIIHDLNENGDNARAIIASVIHPKNEFIAEIYQERAPACNFLHDLLRNQLIASFEEKINAIYQPWYEAIINQYQLNQGRINAFKQDESHQNCYLNLEILKATLPQEVKNNLLKQNGDLNKIGKHFSQWFYKKTLASFEKNYTDVMQLEQNISNLSMLISNFKKQLNEDRHSKSLEILGIYVGKLHLLLASIQSLSFSEQDKEQDKKQKEKFSNELILLINGLIKNFSIPELGNLTPGSDGVLLRSFLCAVFNINAPIFLPKDALAVDLEIQECLKKLRTNSPDIKGNKLPFTLSRVENLPDTYGKPATRELLIQCLSFWFSQSNIKNVSDNTTQPPIFIQQLAEVARKSNQVLNVFEIKKIQSLLDINDKAIYQLNDPLSQIKAALARTSTFSCVTKTYIAYSMLAKKLFKEETIVKNTDMSQVKKKPLNNAEILIEAKTRVAEYKAKNRKLFEKMEGIKERNKKLLLGGGGFAKNKLEKELPLPNEAQIPWQMNQIKKENASIEAAQKEKSESLNLIYFNHSVIDNTPGLFRPMCGMEKLIRTIKSRHKNQEDFNLDETDIQMLKDRLKKHWYKLVEQCKGNEILAANQLFQKPTRSDQVYIAVAALLSAHYRKNNQDVYTYALLMPDSQHLKSRQLLTFKKAEAFLDAEGKSPQMDIASNQAKTISAKADSDEEVLVLTTEDIALKNLIVTRSGYVFDMLQLQSGHFRNPYTQTDFTKEEIEDISYHADAKLITDGLLNTNGITEEVIDWFVEYLNRATFDEGFKENFEDKGWNVKPEFAEEKARQTEAFNDLIRKLRKLPVSQSNKIMDEKIPLDNDNATIKTGFVYKNTCLTIRGVSLAKVVVAYKGDDHGLKNEELINRATKDVYGDTIPIIPRTYYDPRKDKDPMQKLSEPERDFCSLVQREQNKLHFVSKIFSRK